jgi:signal transduction histidine kinase
LPRRGRSVAATVSVALIAVTPVVLTGRVIQLYFSTRDELGRGLRESVGADVDRLAIALELPIWNIDRSEIDRVVESTLRTPEIQAVAVEAAGRLHALRRDAGGRPVPFDGRLDEPGLLREVRSVRMGDQPIGEVTIWATPGLVDAQLRRNVLGHVAGAAAIAAVMVMVLWLFLRRVVIQPLRSLERFAEAVSAGSRPEAALSDARLQGEMAALGDAMQNMVSLLDTRYAQLAVAEASIRALASRLQVVREDEKTRIARDLHDDLGQLLTAAQMELRAVEERLAGHPDDDLANALTDRVVEAGRLVEQTARSVQRIAADLRPGALDELGLAAALRQEARRFQERVGIPCEVSLLGDIPELEGHAAITLYRVAQEALTNVARHAQASRVKVTLAGGEGELLLSVADDGRGLDERAAGPRALGLLGMKERAAMLGGGLRLSPREGGGTVVELRAPRERVVAAGPRRIPG